MKGILNYRLRFWVSNNRRPSDITSLTNQKVTVFNTVFRYISQ